MTTAAPASPLHQVRFIDQYAKANFEPANLGDLALHTIPGKGDRVQLENGVYEVVSVLHKPLEDHVEVILDWRGR